MKTFFRKVKLSFGNSDFYKSAKNETGWKGISFIVKWALFVGFVVGIIGFIILFIFAKPTLTTIGDEMLSLYPNELVVTIKDETLTTNTVVPVVISVPAFLKNDKEKNNEKTRANLVVINPTENPTPEALDAYDTYILLTEKTAIAGDPVNGKIEMHTYKDVKDVVITKANIQKIIEAFQKIGVAVLLAAVIPLAILLFLFLTWLHLLWLLLIALLFFAYFKARQIEITYKEAYKMGIYAIAPLLALEIIAGPIGLTGRWFTSIVMISVIVFASWKWKEDELIVPEHTEPTA